MGSISEYGNTSGVMHLHYILHNRQGNKQFLTTIKIN